MMTATLLSPLLLALAAGIAAPAHAAGRETGIPAATNMPVDSP